MGRLLSASWWVSTLVSTFITMIMIYFIKKIATTYNVPIVTTVAEGV